MEKTVVTFLLPSQPALLTTLTLSMKPKGTCSWEKINRTGQSISTAQTSPTAAAAGPNHCSSLGVQTQREGLNRSWREGQDINPSLHHLLKSDDAALGKRQCSPPHPVFRGAVSRTEAKHSRKCCRVFDLTADETEWGPLSWGQAGTFQWLFSEPSPSQLHRRVKHHQGLQAALRSAGVSVSPLLAHSHGSCSLLRIPGSPC